MRRAGIIIVSCLLCSGCTPEAMDQPDSGVRVDAMPETGGLTFHFASSPELPGEVEDSGESEAFIEGAALILEQVRAIGDSAPGTEQTRIELFQLDWEEGAETLRFPEAPPGMYAQLLGKIVSYEIEGTLRREDETVSFHIGEDTASIPFSVSLSQLGLEPGMTREVEVEVDLGKVIRQIDWEAVDEDGDGMLRVDEASEQIDSVREKLEEGFEHEDD